MKKSIIAMCFILTCPSTLSAFENTHTFYSGYIYGKIKENKANGVIISYRYEPEEKWGLLASILYMKSDFKQFIDESRFKTLSIHNQKSKITALLIGPTYRVTPYLSLFIQAGPKKINYKESIYHPEINTTDSTFIESTNMLGQVGIDFNPLKNIAVNLGYFYSNTTVQRRHIELNSLQLSIGYRF
ncbi:Ail/Lom family outer membrane beta-barrel protein [Proteus myxofaciens]|uniref:Attachment-invasion locus protein n=1 Tax=Proteus myxofaciens ATCC 19692 TaxID=1354337 RepID=A0A198F9K3_9GAMM|nr:Ail/Lom family outer membrane beta-barrel protein [Proteus myxofaciens]OAT21552.1 attachment-invasion locus protein [Proteus myxofaciens ATCC 19692]